jgi:hypothetical protein
MIVPAVGTAGPLLLTTIENVALGCPCVKFPVWLLLTERTGQITAVLAYAWTALVFDAWAVPVSWKAAQFSTVVKLTTCTLALLFDARLPNAHVRVPLAIEQAPFAGLIVQLRLAAAGSALERVAAVAVPVPVLLTVSV